ncbi:serine protease inhibitor 77Ba isoform X2 [Agrilus planipennis]|uniref:Serine protease inhibitor 77Ba isoform X2 n=1 Tax=Agrilus planipennis TaxID=224129 RepID=A0A1W4W9E1_AGRPL|nr:serine protease inhibitor 77Ba isoform X2 [Agrilus planipennis]
MDWIVRKAHFLSFCLFIILTNAQINTELDAIHAASASLNDFAVKLLLQSVDYLGENFNIALAPYPVWSLLTILAEGARDETERQLEETLSIPSGKDRAQFRKSFKTLKKYLKQKSDGIELDISNSIFVTKEQNLNKTYQLLVKNFYDVDVMPIDFKNLIQSQNIINSHIAKLTNNKITNLVTVDLVDAQILLTSTLYFKGRWMLPFNKSATFKDKFYDEKGNEKGEVMMMYQIGTFPFFMLPNIKAHVVELPYGKGDRMSMIVVLPRKKEELSTILKKISAMPFKVILEALEDARQYDEDVMMYLPRFSIISDFILNAILYEMGIKDVFNENVANLLGIFPEYLYLSRVIQQAKIDVDEEGTEAAAAAGGVVSFKNTPPRFYANKPFAFFIIDKQTKSIVFEGKVSNPSSICSTCNVP